MLSQVFGMDDGPFGSRGHGGASGGQRAGVLEATLEELYEGAAKVAIVPHRVRAPGNPLAYIYQHSYRVKLKPSWRDGTSLRLPATDVKLPQIGKTHLPAATLTLRVAPHKYFVRVGDDLVIRVQIHASQVGRKLKLKLPLLDGSVLTFEADGPGHGATREFPGRGMPTDAGAGKLVVQFQVTAEPKSPMAAPTAQPKARPKAQPKSGMHQRSPGSKQ